MNPILKKHEIKRRNKIINIQIPWKFNNGELKWINLEVKEDVFVLRNKSLIYARNENVSQVN